MFYFPLSTGLGRGLFVSRKSSYLLLRISESLKEYSYEKLDVISDRRGLALGLLEASDLYFQKNAHIVMRLPGIDRGNHNHEKGKVTSFRLVNVGLNALSLKCLKTQGLLR